MGLAYHPKESLAAAIDPEAGNEVTAFPSTNHALNDAASSLRDASGQVGFAGATSALPRETVATQPTFFGVAKRIYQIEVGIQCIFLMPAALRFLILRA
ncbi:hypothetical protein C0989_004088 [Termitomyces sp. Mn162]|nr:hypothetical protein C0989_004088 [Termitomyces sp. Mn162]